MKHAIATLIPFALCFLCGISEAYAQSHADSVYAVEPRYGLYGAMGYLYHDAQFRTLPGVPSCCPDYRSGEGTNVSLGLIYEHPFGADWLLGGRIICETPSGKFRSLEPTTFIVNGVATDGAFEHRTDVSYTIIGIQPTAGYRFVDRLFQRLDIVGQAGFGIGATVVPRYNQTETIAEPAGVGIYTDTESPYHNVSSGPIDDISPIILDFRLGVTANVSLNPSRTILLAPEFWYVAGLVPVVRSLPWHTHEARAGLALKWMVSD